MKDFTFRNESSGAFFFAAAEDLTAAWTNLVSFHGVDEASHYNFLFAEEIYFDYEEVAV